MSELRSRTRMTYNADNWMPVVKGSLCNGTQMAGFRNKETGQFRKISQIETPAALRSFLKMYGLRRDQIHKEW